MNIIKAYYYLFYKLYKFWDYISVPKFWSDFKAGISIIVLELWFIFSILNYYDIIKNTKTNIGFSNPIVIITTSIIILLNYISFIHYDNLWKNYYKEFENWSKNKNTLGSIIVSVLVLLITINFFVSMHYFLAIRN